MSKYTSVQAYNLAVKLRSSKTILVEGVSDKTVVKRLLLTCQERSEISGNFVVDEVAIVSDQDLLAGKGNKEKVVAVASQLLGERSKFNWLADREWDGVEGGEGENLQYSTGEWGVYTRGHSIENYWFLSEIIVDYIKMSYGSFLPLSYFKELDNRFELILRLGYAFSCVAKLNQIITRCNGVLRERHLLWDGGRYLFNASLNADLLGRGVGVDIVSSVVDELDAQACQSFGCSTLRWLCHGHLGEEVIWCCAASLAKEFGAESKMTEGISLGYKELKLAHHADALAKRALDEIKPLDNLVRWCG